MPEIKQYYKNCTCCGSGSGSQPCTCSFFDAICSTSPVRTNCKKNFVVNISLDFSGCVGTPIGSCGSGSTSGAETGLVVDEPSTGSSGSECRKTCKNCCDLAPLNYELALECFGNDLAVPKFNGDCIPLVGGHDCYGNRLDCPFFIINANLSGYFGNLFEDGYLDLIFYGATINSCSPLSISGTFNGATTNYSSCLRRCLGIEDGGIYDFNPTCITGTFVITEALP